MVSFPTCRRRPAYDIAGKTVLVTGAGRGIGAATTRALIGAGANVTLVDLTQHGSTPSRPGYLPSACSQSPQTSRAPLT